MDPFELKLKNALTRHEPIPPAELAALNDNIIKAFARKQKAFFRLMAVYLVVLCLMIFALLALFMATTDIKTCLLYAVGMLVMFEGTVLMKLWFWVMHGKIATLREIKLLQLAVAELKQQPAPETAAAAPALPENGGGTASAARPAHKIWPVVLGMVWLLAVAGLVYWGWIQDPCQPRDVSPYFEKTGGAADAKTGTQWEQGFEVTQARQHFYPQVVTRGKTARVWISVAAENSEPMYTGPVEPLWRIGFGQAAPGRYVVKGRTERADGDFTLRIGGVDQVPGTPSPSGLFFLMLSAALIVVIPLVWFENRWLKRIDPELKDW